MNYPNDIEDSIAQEAEIEFEPNSFLEIIFPDVNFFPASSISLINGDIRINGRSIDRNNIIYSSTSSNDSADARFNTLGIRIRGLSNLTAAGINFDIVGGGLTLRINRNFFKSSKYFLTALPKMLL